MRRVLRSVAPCARAGSECLGSSKRLLAPAALAQRVREVGLEGQVDVVDVMRERALESRAAA